MKVEFDDFAPHVPHKSRYVRGIDFLTHEFDLGVEDTLNLIGQLKHEPSSVCVFAEGAMIDFYVYHNELNVQIDGFGLQGGFWHGSNIDLAEARGILEMAQAGVGEFGSQIPITERTWDAY